MSIHVADQDSGSGQTQEQKHSMKMYKGFDENLKCHEFQYEVGQEYIHEGDVSACVSGFHACENPFDVFSFYPPNKARYCEVEGGGKKDKKDDKTSFEKIKIIMELGLGGIIQAGINFCFEKVKWTKKNSATDDFSGASATCYKSGASATGDYSGASATGDCSGASATGDCSGASATGYKSGASATGDYSGASATGYKSGASATGDYSGASATGDYSGASATGDFSGASATGDYSGASATGDYSGASATGDKSSASATGYFSSASATGNFSSASAGNGSVAVSVGMHSRVKGALGAFIVLTEGHANKSNGQCKIDRVKCAKVDGNKIKADVWYTLQNGEFVEANVEDYE